MAELSCDAQNQLSYLRLAETNSCTSLNSIPGGKKKKVPRRLIHCSDGVIEEYSTDEEEEEDTADGDFRLRIDPKTLTWSQWVRYKIRLVATNTLFVADTCGEKLAWLFGITSPKYQYALDEYKRLLAEESEDKDREEREMKVEGERRTSRLADMEGALESCYDSDGLPKSTAADVAAVEMDDVPITPPVTVIMPSLMTPPKSETNDNKF